MSPPRTLSILCFGDSLTSGFHAGGRESHPYSIAFAAQVREALPDTKLYVYTNGKPGDVASLAPFHQRLQAECGFRTPPFLPKGTTRHEPRNKRHHDWLIILGGTNDLAYMIPPQQMYESFQATWDVALAKGTKVLALTIPESKAQPAWVVENRSEINSLILAHRQPNYHALDLHAKLPYHSLSADDRDKYWDDGLHLTDQGYDWMGRHVADGFLAALSSVNRGAGAAGAEEPAPAPSGSQRPVRTNDRTVFEEESGHPGRLSEGYVVVRKKDLW
ncbi:Esterase, SGNH hydrolase-type [Metarhizium album ARSEF 1941]|uniref:Esterase, SGNH hydrolase-type n=1 Tax=Metarhizium album (strain ARSEF 1941) TaxID=1081103 RepID=A0A0B2X2H3_METAS|nr:Esterase, SGNH hydrolase-type [Metarhizium album ARSEF 1941]KHN99937.1 Esterase, SGNH hydrolase-type [Metarhizium album ARSEF 1941]